VASLTPPSEGKQVIKRNTRGFDSMRYPDILNHLNSEIKIHPRPKVESGKGGGRELDTLREVILNAFQGEPAGEIEVRNTYTLRRG